MNPTNRIRAITRIAPTSPRDNVVERCRESEGVPQIHSSLSPMIGGDKRGLKRATRQPCTSRIPSQVSDLTPTRRCRDLCISPSPPDQVRRRLHPLSSRERRSSRVCGRAEGRNPSAFLSPPRMGNKGVEESHTRSYTRWPVSTVLKSEPRSLIWTPRPVMWRNRDPG